MALNIPFLENLMQQQAPQQSGAPVYVQPEGMNTNVLQGLNPPQLTQQDVGMPQIEASRPRRSFLDTVGKISDVLATVGGAQALYQPTLDANTARTQQVDLDAMRKQLLEQQVNAGQQAPQDAMRARLGQALGSITQNPDMASMWPQIAQEAGIDPQRAEAIGQIIQRNPAAAGIFAQSLGYQEPKAASLPSEIQNYAMYQRILTEQGPEAAEQFRGFAQPSMQMTPYQTAQTEIAGKKLSLDERRAAANERITNRRLQLTQQKQEGGAGSDLTPTQRGVVSQKLKSLPVVRQQLERVKTLQREMQQGGTLARGALGGLLPGAVAGGKAEQFDKALGALRKSILSLTRTPGVGSMSNYETALDEMALPSRWGSDAGRVEALQGIDELVNGLESGYKELVPSNAPQRTAPRNAPPSGAVGMLRQNPNLAAQFDAKYGRGAAARVLGGK